MWIGYQNVCMLLLLFFDKMEISPADFTWCWVGWLSFVNTCGCRSVYNFLFLLNSPDSVDVCADWTTWTNTWREVCLPTAAMSGSRCWRTATPWCRERNRSTPSRSNRPPPSATANAPKWMVSCCMCLWERERERDGGGERGGGDSSLMQGEKQVNPITLKQASAKRYMANAPKWIVSCCMCLWEGGGGRQLPHAGRETCQPIMLKVPNLGQVLRPAHQSGWLAVCVCW